MSRRAPPTLQLRLTPARRSGALERETPRPLAERLDALRASHALGVTLGVDVLGGGGEPLRLFLTLRGELGTPALRVLGPRLSPWAWRPETWSPPADAFRGAEVASWHPALRADREAPWRSAGDPEHLSPWSTLLPVLAALPHRTWVRWTARPCGPSSSSPLARSLPLPRSDHDTPVPVASPHATGRSLEDLRGERGPGPYWETGGILVTWGDSARRRGELSRLIASVSGAPGGTHFRLTWARTEHQRRTCVQRAWCGELPSRTGYPWEWFRPAASLSPSELDLWLPPWELRGTTGGGVTGTAAPWSFPVGSESSGVDAVWAVQPREGHHALLAGETGMGKSSLLEHLGRAFVERDASVILVDPLGETARSFLSHLPPGARERVRWVSPLASPVGINALEVPPGLEGEAARAERERRVGELVTMLHRVRAERYGETVFWGPRIEDILRRVFSLLVEVPGATFTTAAELLRDPEHWAGPWPRQAGRSSSMSELYEGLRREPRDELQGALRVVQEVAQSEALSRLLSDPHPRWSLDETLVPGAITVLALERAGIGVRASSYLGSAYLSLLWSHLLARRAADGPAPGKVVLLLDEVQEYANGALGEMLRMGRRYQLHVLAATQSVSALSPPLREVLLTNSRDLFLFRGSLADAKWAREGLGLEEARALTSLPRGHALGLFGKGHAIVELRVTLPPPPATASEEARLVEAVCQRSRGPARPPDAAPGRSPPTAPPAGEGVTSRSVPSPSDGARGEVVDLPLLTLVLRALETPEGEPFAVEVEAVRRLCGGNEAAFRRLGGRLKGAGALVRTERHDGERRWWLVREALLELHPPPWEPEALEVARARVRDLDPPPREPRSLPVGGTSSREPEGTPEA